MLFFLVKLLKEYLEKLQDMNDIPIPGESVDDEIA